MKISQFLAPDDILIDVRAQLKSQLIRELADHAAAKLGLETQEVLSALLAREELGSTGLGSGIAIPHARIDGVKQPFGVMARLYRPIDFEAIDDAPVDLVFLLLLPKSENADSLAALALVSRKLRSPSDVMRMRQARSSPELYDALVER